MKIAVTFLPLLVAFFVGDSNQQCFSANDQPEDRTLRHDLYTGQQSFSLALLQAINHLMPTENLFFSPYSTYHALTIAYFLSGNQTEQYLKKTLRLNESKAKKDIYYAYKLDKFTTEVRTHGALYEFTSANKIYVSDQVHVRSCIQDNFPKELELTAFQKNPEAARLQINQWVESTTHDMIKDLLPPGSIDSGTNLAIVNAAYFKGMWENKFDPNQTKPEIFYVNPSKQIMVDMMHVEGTFNHDVSEELGAHILEMPYQGGNISMYVLLPPFAKEGAVDDTLKKLTLERFASIVDSKTLSSKTVQVALPKFTLEHTIELVPILEQLGVGNLFQSDADFSTLTNASDVSVGRGIHKARIAVDEQGVKAAAATVFFTWRMQDDTDDTPVEFKCNRPFIFLIYQKETHTILFTGVYRNPNASA